MEPALRAKIANLVMACRNYGRMSTNMLLEEPVCAESGWRQEPAEIDPSAVEPMDRTSCAPSKLVVYKKRTVTKQWPVET